MDATGRYTGLYRGRALIGKLYSGVIDARVRYRCRVRVVVY